MKKSLERAYPWPAAGVTQNPFGASLIVSRHSRELLQAVRVNAIYSPKSETPLCGLAEFAALTVEILRLFVRSRIRDLTFLA